MNRPRSETIVFNGIKFRRYPDSKNLNDRNYYRPRSNHIKHGISYLHREIWKSVHGDIPDGCDIHHKDENPLNNSIDNLECLSKSDHAMLHAELMPEWKREWVRGQLNTHARPKAINWHKSAEGIEFHRLLGVWSWDREPITKTCAYCGKQFSTKAAQEAVRFCSNNCRTQSRRVSRVDDETRICERCNSPFKANKYLKTRFCTKSCAASYRNTHRKPRNRP